MRIAIDIDSTLHHYWDQFQQVVRHRYGIELPYERHTTWGVEQLDPEQLKQCIGETHTERWVLAAEPYPYAVETVRAWHADGHYIHITSHRASESHAVTERWLDSIGLPFDDLHCSYDKIARCVELGIDVLIDDSPVNIARAAEHDIVAATIIHPWNRELCERDGHIGATDWPQLARELARILQSPLRTDASSA